MVLYSIREQTHDIDLGCTADLADRLEKHGVPVIRQPDGGRKFTIGEDVELFENWLYDTVQFIDGIPVISLKSLIEMKQRLGREKDRRDIRLIAVFLAKKYAKILYNQALLIAGLPLDDPSDYTDLICSLW